MAAEACGFPRAPALCIQLPATQECSLHRHSSVPLGPGCHQPFGKARSFLLGNILGGKVMPPALPAGGILLYPGPDPALSPQSWIPTGTSCRA